MSYQQYRDQTDALPGVVNNYLKAAVNARDINALIAYRHLRFIASRYVHLAPNCRAVYIGKDSWGKERLELPTPQLMLLVTADLDNDGLIVDCADHVDLRLLHTALRSIDIYPERDSDEAFPLTLGKFAELYHALWDFPGE